LVIQHANDLDLDCRVWVSKIWTSRIIRRKERKTM